MKETSHDIMREHIDGFETSSKKWLVAALFALLIGVGCLWMLNQMSGGKQPQSKDVPPSSAQTVGTQDAPKESADETPQVKDADPSGGVPCEEVTVVTPEVPKASGDKQPEIKDGEASDEGTGTETTSVTSETTKERDGEQSGDLSGVLSGDNTFNRTFEVSLSKGIVSKDGISSDTSSNSLSDGGNAQ